MIFYLYRQTISLKTNDCKKKVDGSFLNFQKNFPMTYSDSIVQSEIILNDKLKTKSMTNIMKNI